MRGEDTVIAAAHAPSAVRNHQDMKTVLVPDGEARFESALDHGQFAVLDRGATIDIDAVG